MEKVKEKVKAAFDPTQQKDDEMLKRYQSAEKHKEEGSAPSTETELQPDNRGVDSSVGLQPGNHETTDSSAGLQPPRSGEAVDTIKEDLQPGSGKDYQNTPLQPGSGGQDPEGPTKEVLEPGSGR